MKNQIFHINFPGGQVRPENLLALIDNLEALEVSNVYIHDRQGLAVEIPEIWSERFRQWALNYPYQVVSRESGIRNVITSQVALGNFPQQDWLDEIVFHEIFEELPQHLNVPVSIVDGLQNLVPVSNSELNIIPSEQKDFWFVLLSPSGEEEKGLFPYLVHTLEVVALIKAFDKGYSSNGLDISRNNIRMIADGLKFKKPLEQSDQVPQSYLKLFPFIEGFHRINESAWLGLYRKNNLYTTDWLKRLSKACLKQKEGTIYFTLWKSVLVKDLAADHEASWRNTLMQHGLRFMHNPHELNWYVLAEDRVGWQAKNHIIRKFEKLEQKGTGRNNSSTSPEDRIQVDPSSISIGMVYEDVFPATSIVIERKPYISHRFSNYWLCNYNLYYRTNFDPGCPELHRFASGLAFTELTESLLALFEYFFRENFKDGKELPSYRFKRLLEGSSAGKHGSDKSEKAHTDHEKFQCSQCMTIYDPEYGDPTRNIAPDTSFEKLPVYDCPVCGAPKFAFEPLKPLEKV